jgi:hypothetical protein
MLQQIQHESKGAQRFLLCIVMVFLLAPLPISPASAQIGTGVPRIKQPPLVRITGAFVALEEKQRGGLRTLAARVKDRTWNLRIKEIKVLTGSTNSGWSLLNDLFPPRLHLIGPDELLAPLQQDDIAGRPLILEGRLYVGDHQLYVTAVTVPDQ